LTEASDEAVGGRIVILHVLFKHPGSNTLVVGGSMGVVSKKRRTMNREPGKNANVFVVGSALEAKQSQRSIGLGIVLGTFALGIIEVGVERPVDGAV
jgi:hypothetical protein